MRRGNRRAARISEAYRRGRGPIVGEAPRSYWDVRAMLLELLLVLAGTLAVAWWRS